MLQGEVLVFEFVAADGFAASSVMVCKIASLTHEASAQSTEVFASLWYYVRAELQENEKQNTKFVRKSDNRKSSDRTLF